MLRFEAAFFVLALNELKTVATAIKDLAGAAGKKDGMQMMHQLFDKMVEHSAVLPSASDFNLKIHILRKRLENTSAQELGILLEALHQDILADLLKPAFLLIPEHKVELFDQTVPPFGENVVHVFPNAVDDIAAASRCLALDEWTACVFHAMRVLEHALRRFAAELNIPMSIAYEENWHNIIDMIEKECRVAQNAQRSPTKAETLKFYSDAAVNFRYFKDAWRNHVSHSKESYAELQSNTIYDHGREFVQVLAVNLEPMK